MPQQPEWTWADVEADVKPRVDTVPICLDGTVQSELEEVRRQLRSARADDTLDSGSQSLQDRLVELETQAEAATREFTVRAIPHARWRDLMVKHRSENPEERYDAGTFVPAALAACCDQFTDEEQARRAVDEHLTTGQVLKLFGRIRALNEGDDRVPTTRGR